MMPPGQIAGFSPAIAYLGSLDQLIVKQKKELMESKRSLYCIRLPFFLCLPYSRIFQNYHRPIILTGAEGGGGGAGGSVGGGTRDYSCLNPP